jgi:Spy/CpxP family protein refolding chaperone
MGCPRVFGAAVAIAAIFASAAGISLAADESATPAAKPAAGGMSIRASGLPLLRADVVVKDLALSDDQIAAIKKIDEEATRQISELRESLKNATLDERRAKMSEAQQAIAKKVDAVFNDTQRARFAEIRLQMLGPAALTEKSVADELKLSDEQKTKLADVADARRKAYRAAVEAAGNDRNAARPQIAEIVKDAAAKMVAVLTPEQQDAFEKLKGKKLDLGTAAFGARGGGGRGIPKTESK